MTTLGYVPAMDDPGVMPGRLQRLLEANGCSDVSVTGYEKMTGGYSRLMARFDASFTLDGVATSGSYVLRGDPPPGQAIIETDRTQEFEVIRAVAPYLNTPAARFLDADGSHVGTPALVIDFSPAESTLPWIDQHGMAPLPSKLAELAVEKLAPISTEMARLMADTAEIDRILRRGADKGCPGRL